MYSNKQQDNVTWMARDTQHSSLYPFGWVWLGYCHHIKPVLTQSSPVAYITLRYEHQFTNAVRFLLSIKLWFNGLVCSLLHLYLTLPRSCEGLKSTTVHSPINRYPYRHACMIQTGYIFSAAPQQHRSDVRGVPQLDVLDETHKPRALSWGKPQNTTPKTQNIYVKYFNLNKVACFFFPPLPPASKPTSRGDNWDEYLSGRQNMEHIRCLRIPGRCRHSSAHRP